MPPCGFESHPRHFDSMELPLYILAVIGFAAALWRLLRAALRLARRGVDAFLAREVAETRAQRGDLTGMAEARDWAARARRARLRAIAEACFWLALLVLPPLLLPSPVVAYAAYAVLWLFVRGLEARAGVTARKP